MSKFKSTSPHVCLYCGVTTGKRANLGRHLMIFNPETKDPTCGGLNIPLPKDIFIADIVPYYKSDVATMHVIDSKYIKAQFKKVDVLENRIIAQSKTIDALQTQVRQRKNHIESGIIDRTEDDTKKIHALQKQVRRLREISPKKRPRPRKTYGSISGRQKRRRVVNMIIDNAEDTPEETMAKFQKSLEAVTPDKDLIWLLRATLKYGAAVIRRHVEDRMAITDQLVMDPDKFTALEAQLRLSRRGTELLHRVAAEHGQNGQSIFPTRTERSDSRKKVIPSGCVAGEDKA